jgi:pyruvate dehydrogenase (quinone)
MADAVADFLIERLVEWGISRIYGYPGDVKKGITAALCKNKDEGAHRRAAPAA